MNRILWEHPDSRFPACTEGEASILFLGDVALARGIGRSIDQHGSAFPFARIPKSFFDTDILCFNLECCLSNRGTPWEPKPVHLRGKPDYLAAIPTGARSVVANVANNHFLDYGEEAALDTRSELELRGFHCIGATGSDVDGQPLILRTTSGSVAFLAFSPSAHRLENQASINIPSHRPETIRNQVQDARKSADLVVASFHMGVEYCQFVDRNCRRMAHLAVESGADCVICHHSHVTQGIERYRDGLIFHGLGNFLLDISPDRRPDAALTIAPRLWIKEGKIVRVIIHPFALNESFQPCPVEGEAFDSFRKRIQRLSGSLESPLGQIGNSLAASCHRLLLQSSSALEMLRHKGISRTVSYYAGRIQEKLTG